MRTPVVQTKMAVVTAVVGAAMSVTLYLSIALHKLSEFKWPDGQVVVVGASTGTGVVFFFAYILTWVCAALAIGAAVNVAPASSGKKRYCTECGCRKQPHDDPANNLCWECYTEPQHA